jgi:hypothetical protein
LIELANASATVGRSWFSHFAKLSKLCMPPSAKKVPGLAE